MNYPNLTTGFISTAEQAEDSSALIAGAVIADAHQDAEGLELYRICTPQELMTSACLAATEVTLSVTNRVPRLAADKLYLAVHRDSGCGPEEHLLAMRMLRATARAVDGTGIIDLDLDDFGEVDHLAASIEAFRRAAAASGILPVAVARAIRDQAPSSLVVS